MSSLLARALCKIGLHDGISQRQFIFNGRVSLVPDRMADFWYCNVYCRHCGKFLYADREQVDA